mmetsp:Transcript_100588/g.215599  ORF Transcript_100588/g.215599 Transcript_100588/m.215599 type:complete len:303 (-) Transcript_100588:45-953(-)
MEVGDRHLGAIEAAPDCHEMTEHHGGVVGTGVGCIAESQRRQDEVSALVGAQLDDHELAADPTFLAAVHAAAEDDGAIVRTWDATRYRTERVRPAAELPLPRLCLQDLPMVVCLCLVATLHARCCEAVPFHDLGCDLQAIWGVQWGWRLANAAAMHEDLVALGLRQDSHRMLEARPGGLALLRVVVSRCRRRRVTRRGGSSTPSGIFAAAGGALPRCCIGFFLRCSMTGFRLYLVLLFLGLHRSPCARFGVVYAQVTGDCGRWPARFPKGCPRAFRHLRLESSEHDEEFSEHHNRKSLQALG